MNTPSNAFDLAMKLSDAERAELAHRLLLSLEPETSDDEEVASAWADEIDARLVKIANGNYHAHNWRDAIREVREGLKKDAAS
jgi:hypothetical protein